MRSAAQAKDRVLGGLADRTKGGLALTGPSVRGFEAAARRRPRQPSGSVTPDAASWAARSVLRRPRPSAVVDSARATSTSWVFEARSSHQPSAVRTRTPSMSLTSAAACRSRSATSSTTANLRVLGAGKAQLRRVDDLRQNASQRRQAMRAAAEDAEQPHRDIDRVVKAVIAVGEEDVAAHLAGERCAGFGKQCLDRRVSGRGHDRTARQPGRSRRTAPGWP